MIVIRIAMTASLKASSRVLVIELRLPASNRDKGDSAPRANLSDMRIRYRLSTRLLAAAAAGLLVTALAPATGAGAKAPKVTSCKGGKAAGFPCKGIDLVAQVPADQIGGARVADVWGWVDPETNAEYAILGSTHGIQFLDVTDPTKPIYLGELLGKAETALIWMEMEIVNDHLYAVCDLSPCNVQIFDLTQLRGAESAETYIVNSVFPIPNAHSIDSNPKTNHIFVNGSLLVAGGAPVILDVSQPLAPVPVGAMADDGYTHDSLCRNYEGPDKAYRGNEICFNFNEDTITIYDVTANPTMPEQLARVTYDTASYVHSGALTKDHSTLISTDEGDEGDAGTPTTLYIWDVSKLTKPKLLGQWSNKTSSIDHNIYSEADALYHANYVDGFRILDTKNAHKGDLQEVAYFDTMPDAGTPDFSGAWAAYPYLPSGNVLVGDMSGQGLFIVRPQAAVLKRLGVKR
jgi:choice-of-anchor B domain-containing protein